MILRDYQTNAVQSIYDYFRVAEGNPVLELPTGSGKSLVQAEFARQVLMTIKAGQRILCLTHVKELISQNHDELMGIWPDAPAGVYSASLNRRDTRHPIIFASIQSVYRRALELGRFNLVIIDECHLVSNKGATMYRAFLDELKEINPRLKVIGMSATPYRLDNGPLTAGENAIFTDLISAKKLGAELGRLVELGHLAPLVTPGDALPQLSTQGVGKRGGEFIPSALGKAVAEQASITAAACEEIVRLGADRQCWIVFAASVAHCDEIHAHLTDFGIDCAIVTGETDPSLREMRIDALREGSIRALISVNVLSTGFNVRQVDLLAMMRPTGSASLYCQQAGRGMRVHPDKADCLVLDFAGNIDTHGPVDHVKPPPVKSGKGGGEAVQKECPECVMLIPAGAMTCGFCGHQFPPHQIKIEERASVSKILGKPEPVEAIPDAAEYGVHRKPGKPDSLRVTYWAEGRRVGAQWICLLHQGRAQTLAEMWWSDFVGTRYPQSIQEAVNECETVARLPSKILIDKSGKFPMVTRAMK